jgi:tRNA modification GTPase
LLTDAQQTAILKDGLKCVICGKTNVGKSTFFNYLLKEERAIVSELAGTTRDVIEETVKIKGLPLRLYDTAGMLEPRNVIEEKAIEKSANIFNGANVIILMLDGSGALTQEDLFLLKKVKELTQPEKAHQKNKNVIILINKADLKQRIKFKEIANFSVPKLRISALSGAGIKDFEEEIFKISYRQMIKKEDIVFLGRYQLQLLKKISDSLSECVSFLNAGHSVDFVNFSLKESLDNLGKLSGEIVSADVLEDIFGDFCIGK